ncbi:MAG: pyruvate formate-lyase [Clostridia bacterium]|nr:pyruvate formate-lyase [Clostridia bacterium]
MEDLRQFILDRKHRAFRRAVDRNLAAEYSALGLSPRERMTRRFEYLMSLETPVFLPGEKIVFLRTVENIPDCFTEEEWEGFRKEHFIHELGYLSNISPDYETVLREGLSSLRERGDEYVKRMIDAIFALSDRYRDEAVKQGRDDVAQILSRIPRQGATTFREALQLFRILHFSLWMEGNYHITTGRFDQYMWPYLKSDLEEGRLTEESAFALLKDFFLSFNKDNDLYPGVQQGDNGQSMVLGGITRDGAPAFNLLSKLCLQASRENLMIDPKINLRVSSDTPDEIYALGTELTKAGLGFPQYSNDDVVIDALVRKGYDLEDARDYVVAACWEFIIPKYGMDIDNIAALNFPKVINQVVHASARFASYEEFSQAVRAEIFAECDRQIRRKEYDNSPEKSFHVWFVPSPLMESLMCPKYYNFGMHGTGIATAADSMAAIRKYVFEENSVAWERLVSAVDNDFANEPELLHTLRYDAPKMGQNLPTPDEAAVFLLDCFADALEGRKTPMGGVWRAGTGSAMFYLLHAADLPASPDGRRKGEPFGANFSPSLFARTKGPFSVIASFSKPHLERVCNGGPLTMEFSSSVFDTAEGIEKTAKLVQSFIRMGGHQLQLNSVNPDTLRDAQKNPEAYRGLIVRIWGWSAYFTELDKEYQDHVIARQEYSL